MKKHEVDTWLASLKKDRRWLAEQSGYSYDYVRNSLAPSAPELPVKFVNAIDRVAESQAAIMPIGYSEIFLDDSQLDRADRASRMIQSESLAEFCRDAIRFRANEILTGNFDPVEAQLDPAKKTPRKNGTEK